MKETNVAKIRFDFKYTASVKQITGALRTLKLMELVDYTPENRMWKIAFELNKKYYWDFI